MSKTVSLENSELFQGLSEEMVAQVRAISREEHFEAGSKIFHEDDPATQLYILQSGLVELVFTNPAGPDRAEFRITRIHPGKVFAWTALSGSRNLTAQANAVEDSDAFIIPGQELEVIMSEEPRMGYVVMRRLLQVVAGRLRDTRTQLRWLLNSM